jgi:hypothetical protein
VTFLARWPADKAMQHTGDRIRELTRRSRLLLDPKWVVEDLNRFLGGWAVAVAWRRNLMATVDGAGFSHRLLEHLDKLASRRGHTLIYSCGWELDQQEKAAIRLVPEHACGSGVTHTGRK